MNEKGRIMRRVGLFFTIFFVSFTCRVYAENKVNIRVIQNDLISKNIEVDESVTYLTFSGPGIKSITSIEGLEKLKSLESLNFYNLKFDNMDFLNSCHNLKKLWISGCTITSFSFIEKIIELEEIELDFYIDSSKNEQIKEKPIDLKQLQNLKRIHFIGLIKEENQIKKYKSIPQFQNVPSECTLIMEDQGIENLSDIDISILKQFKYVDLTANPVLNTKDIKSIENILLNN